MLESLLRASNLFYLNPPAIGFETKDRNAHAFRLINAWCSPKKGLAWLDNMYYASEAWNAGNCVKVLGYIPYVGALVGLYRIYQATQKKWVPTDNILDKKWSHIARGCVEVALGIIGYSGLPLLIFDIAVTILHGCQSRVREKAVILKAIQEMAPSLTSGCSLLDQMI